MYSIPLLSGPFDPAAVVGALNSVITRVNAGINTCVRLGNGVAILTGEAEPENGVTGAGVAGVGSLYVYACVGNPAKAQVYFQSGTCEAPVWVLMLRNDTPG